MVRNIITAVIALLIGVFIGWKGSDIAKDGHDGIQWKFNDAASRGDIREMERLIAAGADPLSFPSYADGAVTGASPLLEAASAGEPDAVKFLINLGADVNQQESDTTPLGSAEHRLDQTEATIQILRAHIEARKDGFHTKTIMEANKEQMATPRKPSD